MDAEALLKGSLRVGDWCEVEKLTLEDTKPLNGTVVRLDHFDTRTRKWAFVVEQPKTSKAKREPPIRRLRDKYGEVGLDMCTQDLKDPWSQDPLKKSTTLFTHSTRIKNVFGTAKHTGPSVEVDRAEPEYSNLLLGTYFFLLRTVFLDGKAKG